MNVPDHLIYPSEYFADAFKARHDEGVERLRTSSVAFVGLARNCAPHLTANLVRLENLAEHCGSWRLHVSTNDNEDNTDQVLTDFCAHHRQATFASQRLGRKQYGAEFAGRRTIALAEYRTACQRWVAENAANSDYTIVIDWDAQGGWSHAGLLNGIGWLEELPNAYGMASVSLFEHLVWAIGQDGTSRLQPAWLGYDSWAFRWNTYLDTYTRGQGGWFHQWIPFVGSPPIQVCSAFGGLCIYRTEDYLKGTYDGSEDCEHTEMHRTIAERTGKHLFYNPSQRMIMRWLDACELPSQGVE